MIMLSPLYSLTHLQDPEYHGQSYSGTLDVHLKGNIFCVPKLARFSHIHVGMLYVIV